jgi:hypothetical protein
METLTAIAQNFILFFLGIITGMVVGGYLQHKTKWMDKLAKFLS